MLYTNNQKSSLRLLHWVQFRYIAYSVIFLSPLPFGSTSAVWQWFWVLYIGGVSVVFFLREKKGTFDLESPARKIIAPLLLVAVFIIWGCAQALVPMEPTMPESKLGVSHVFEYTNKISANPYATMANAAFFLAHIIFFLLVYSLCIKNNNMEQLIFLCGIAALGYSFYGLIEFFIGNEKVLWIIKNKPLYGPESLSSTFINRNNYAAFSGLGVQCLIASAFHLFNRKKLYSGASFFIRFGWLVLAIYLVATSVFLSNSRAGTLSTAFGVCLLVLLSFRPKPFFRQKKLRIASAAIAFLAVICVVALSGNDLVQRIENGDGVDDRANLYRTTITVILERPVIGSGLGTFEETLQAFRDQSVDLFFRRGHNDYLEIAMTAGLPAALLLILAFFFILKEFLSSRRRQPFHQPTIALGISFMVQMALHSALDFPLQIPAISYFWCGILAASFAASYRSRVSAR